MRRPPCTLVRGIALMEALIAILLLSVCALAYAALQVRGLQTNSGSLWRSKAILLANDIADRLRANRSGVTQGAYDNLQAVNAPNCGIASVCTPQAMAQLDFQQWRSTLAEQLPSGSGVVCKDATPDDGLANSAACDGSGDMFAVKVFWSERGEAQRLVVAVRP